MLARTLGYQTDLFFIEKNGFVERRDRYVVARTPENPTYYWGNFLLYPEPPSAQSSPRWLADFEHEFPDAAHRAFGWDSTSAGDPSVLQGAGLQLSDLIVMTAPRVAPPRNGDLEIAVRPLESDAEWRDAIETGVRVQQEEEPVDETAFRHFKTVRYRNYRALQASGFGAIYGAFVDGVLAGSLGIFGEADFGRFQAVEVDPRYRRHGVCSRLLFEASEDFRNGRHVQRFVIVALSDGPHDAAAIYAAAGFRRAEQMWGIWKRP